MSVAELAVPARYWLDLARGDLAAARAVSTNADLPPRVAVGLAHQAAEKALKALIAFLGSDPPRSHDLVALAHRVGTAVLLDVGDEDLRTLTDAHSESRFQTTEASPTTARRPPRSSHWS
jgi:HEPN domain-containing protein